MYYFCIINQNELHLTRLITFNNLKKRIMKKIFLSVMLTVLTVAYAPAQDAASQTPNNATISHWSVGLKAGLDYYRVTPFSTFGTTNWSKYINNAGWTLPGLFVEYTINPLIGFGGDLSYLTYNRNTGSGHTLDFTLFGSSNLSNLLVPVRTGFWSKVNVYGNLGGGLGFYSYKVYSTGANQTLKSPLITTGLNAEYNLSNSWAIGAEAQYRYYFRENLGGIWSSNASGNDAYVGTVSLRYKFGANGDKKHARNMSMEEWKPTVTPEMMKKISDDGIAKAVAKADAKADANTQSRLKAVEDDNADIKAKLQKLQDDLKALPTQAQAQAQQNETVNASFQNIEFELGSKKLTAASCATLDKIATILKNNPTWAKFKVVGNADNTGSSAFNKRLSKDRAQAVKNYLVSKGVSTSAITTIGNGDKNPIATNNTADGRKQNRRVEFEISK